jgi:hypothetical protein
VTQPRSQTSYFLKNPIAHHGGVAGGHRNSSNLALD